MTRYTEEQYQKLLKRSATLSLPTTAKLPKFRNKKTVANGVTFDSGKEARRWQELQMLALSGAITNLRRQVSYDLCVNGILICRYIADAVYLENGETKVEDTKSPATQRERSFVLKRKLMKAVHGIEIAIA